MSAAEPSQGANRSLAEQSAAAIATSAGGRPLSPIRTLFKRELAAYFATPVAYVFIVIFLVLAGTFTFYVNGVTTTTHTASITDCAFSTSSEA